MAFWTLLLGGPAHLGLTGDKGHLLDTVLGQGDGWQRSRRLSWGWGWSSRAAPCSLVNGQLCGRRRPGPDIWSLVSSPAIHRAARLPSPTSPGTTARPPLQHDTQNPFSRTKTEPASEARPGTQHSRRLLVATRGEAGRPPPPACTARRAGSNHSPLAVGSRARGLASVFSREKWTRINVHLPVPTPGPEERPAK